MELVFLFIGLTIGFIVAWLMAPKRFDKTQIVKELETRITELETDIKISEEKLSNSSKSASEQQEQLQKLINEQKLELLNERNNVVRLNSALATKNAEFTALDDKLKTQTQEIEELYKKFNDQFTNLAQRILEEKSEKFTQQNKENIDAILKPLNDKLFDFGKKVEDSYEKTTKDSTRLQTEIQRLYELNSKISEDANNLTKALKGDVKKQGNWGEMILEKILERSGLRKDVEYKTQDSFRDEENRLYKPDVVIYLPENKNIIIDAKVSLTAYDQMVNAETKEEQEQFAKQHLQSFRKHIDELANKEYHKLPDVNAPEYVLMFVPIEASFGVAINQDAELFNYAWDKRIVIVSPSTLIATLMTISSIWRQENQTKNAIEIAKQSGDLYDKFVSLMDDLKKVGDRLRQTTADYDKAMNKLSEGRGNLINRVQTIKKLGAKASKSIDQNILDLATEEE